MPIGPLKNLPVFSKNNNSISRSKQGGFSDINQKKQDIKNAKTSIARVVGGGVKKSTSIYHPDGLQKKATISATRSAVVEESLDREQASQEEIDERRYNYIRRKMLAKRRKAEKEQIKNDKYNINSSDKKVSEKLARAKEKDPLTYSSINKKDQEYFEKLIQPHQKIGKISLAVKREIKKQLEKDRGSGLISDSDVGVFKKVVDRM